MGSGLARAFLFPLALVESDGGFEHQEDIVAGALDLADGLSDRFGIRERFIDGVPEFLHQLLQPVVHFPSPAGVQKEPPADGTRIVHRGLQTKPHYWY